MSDIRSSCDACARLSAFGLMSGAPRTKADAISGIDRKKSSTNGTKRPKNFLTSKSLREEILVIRLVRINHRSLLYSHRIKYGLLLCFCSRRSVNLFTPRQRKTETRKNLKLSTSSWVRKVSSCSEASSTRTRTTKSKSSSVIL